MREDDTAPVWLVRYAAVCWRLLVLFALAYAISLTVRALQLVIVPLLLALFITAVLFRPIRALRRVRVPLAVSAALGAALFVTALAATVLAAGLIVRGERSDIADSVRRGWETLRLWIAEEGGSFAGVGVQDLIDKASSSLGARSGEVAALLVTGAAGIATAVAEVILAAVIAFFLLRDGDVLVGDFLERLPDDTGERLGDTGSKMWSRVEAYIRGIALTSLANTLLFGGALLLIGVPFVVPIMFITFVGSFVPYAGPILATAVAALVALGNNGSVPTLWVIASGIMVQIIEGNIFHPFVLGYTVRLPPIVVLLAVTSGAAIAGLIGTLVAVPLVAAASVLFETADEPEGS